MRNRLFSVIFLLLTLTSFGQANYTGYIGKYPIELIAELYPDGNVNAIYCYQNVDDPIKLKGKLTGKTLTLYEKGKTGKNSATLIFSHFDNKEKTISGTWTNLITKKELSITLNKDFDMEDGEETEWKDREIIQPVTLNNLYFRLLVSKNKDDFTARVTGIKILEKKTDRLVQRIALDCQLLGLNNVSTGDFNFDGLPDFSVFETGYAGPNTSSLYFLYDPKTKQYAESGFTGVSLTFNEKSKTIRELNQCCAGRQQTTAVYKVVKNKMILIEEHCFVWNEKKKDLVERKMNDCQ